MKSRNAILSKIRAGLGARPEDPVRRAIVEERIAARTRHLTPERVKGKSPGQLLKLFRGFLEGQSATVLDVGTRQEIPAAVTGYLRANNLPARLRVGGDSILTQLPWGTEAHLEVLLGKAQPGDDVGMTHAAAAVAETGTMVLASGADNPVTLNFMPETHIVVVEERDLVAAYEDAWERIRGRFGDGAMPRTVNLISGPSRTGDIGGRIVMGAHGPRRMCVIIVRDAGVVG
jgi:L-lactate dehydrogenase complex protein LldG